MMRRDTTLATIIPFIRTKIFGWKGEQLEELDVLKFFYCCIGPHLLSYGRKDGSISKGNFFLHQLCERVQTFWV